MTRRKKSSFTIEKCRQLAVDRGGKLLSQNVSPNRKLQWQCNEGHMFDLTPYKVSRWGKWCPECGCSIGEREIRKFLRDNMIPFLPQYTVAELPSRRYDFYFEYDGLRYLVEYDGEQHFRYIRKFHHKTSKFKESQIVDRIKTSVALQTGYRVIRIDYNERDNIPYHLISAIRSDAALYLSNSETYDYLYAEDITASQWRKHLAKN